MSLNDWILKEWGNGYLASYNKLYIIRITFKDSHLDLVKKGLKIS